MPTPDPPTPTHEDMRGELNGWLDSRQTRAWRRYVEQAESTAAELLKARERIAELELEVSGLHVALHASERRAAQAAGAALKFNCERCGDKQ